MTKTKTITIHTRKGGDGKSTSTINLGFFLAEKGFKVLVGDLDDQQNTTKNISSIVQNDKTIEDLFLKDDISLNDVVVQTESKNLWILPASSNLSGVIKYLDGEVGGHNILREKIKDNNFFDYIIFDTSPSLNILVISALCASDYIFTPLTTKFFSMQGLAQTMQSFKKVTDRLNPDLKLLGIAFVCHDGRTVLANEIIAQVKSKYAKELFATIIGVNIKIEEAQTKKQSILTYSPLDRGAEQYRQLGDEILERLASFETAKEA